MTIAPVSGLGRCPRACQGLTLLIAFALAACATPSPGDQAVVSTSPVGIVEPQSVAPAASIESPATAISLSSAPSTDTSRSVLPVPEVPAALAAAPTPADAAALTILLRDAYQFRLLSAAQLAAETENLEILERLEPTAEHRLRWALALAQTLQIQDTQRALGLIQIVLESPDPQSVALRPLAHLLGHLLREQRRLDLQNERLSQQLRESQRRVEQLNDRIEAMRAIERSLNRPLPLSAPPRPNTP